MLFIGLMVPSRSAMEIVKSGAGKVARSCERQIQKWLDKDIQIEFVPKIGKIKS